MFHSRYTHTHDILDEITVLTNIHSFVFASLVCVTAGDIQPDGYWVGASARVRANFSSLYETTVPIKMID